MHGVQRPALGLDAVDLALVRLLQRDARRTNKELADEVGIAQSTCLERIRALRAAGVVRGWHADVDPAALGRPLRAMLSVRLRPKTTDSVRAFREDMLAAPEVRAVWMVTGADDFLVEVAAPDVEGLREFVLAQVTARADVVDARTAIVYEEVRVWEIPPAPAPPAVAPALSAPGGLAGPDAGRAPPGRRRRSAP